MTEGQPHETRLTWTRLWKAIAILLVCTLIGCTGPSQFTIKPTDHLDRNGARSIEENLDMCRGEAFSATKNERPIGSYILVPAFLLTLGGFVEYDPYNIFLRRTNDPHFNNVVITSAAIASLVAAMIAGAAYWIQSTRYWHLYDDHVARCLMDQGYEISY